MANSPVYELLLRNGEILKGRDVIIAGDVLDPMILSLIKESKSAKVICDNYVICSAMAAMVGKTLDHTFPQCISYKHLKLYFADIDSVKDTIAKADTLLLLVSKQKQQTIKLLNILKDKLTPSAYIYTAGANDGGGKSADSILKAAGPVQKIDLARKCTLFKAIYEKDFDTYKKAPDISFEAAGFHFDLKQDPAVFSLGKLDPGTALLLESLKDHIPQGNALDLGCGCGVVGIFLSKLGFKSITSSDVSASALALCSENAKQNGVSDIKVIAADMLSGLDKYSLIAVNPPFHVGINTTTAPTVNMIMKAKDHLNADGVMYLVANSHLGYEKILKENFPSVETVSKNNGFVVYRAKS